MTIRMGGDIKIYERKDQNTNHFLKICYLQGYIKSILEVLIYIYICFGLIFKIFFMHVTFLNDFF